jgi:hypothetical protein
MPAKRIGDVGPRSHGDALHDTFGLLVNSLHIRRSGEAGDGGPNPAGLVPLLPGREPQRARKLSAADQRERSKSKEEIADVIGVKVATLQVTFRAMSMGDLISQL